MLGSEQSCGRGEGGGGGLDQVLMSKLCHCPLLEKSPWFLFSRAIKKSEFIQRTLQMCVCVWSLFCSRCISPGNSPVHPAVSLQLHAAAFEDVVYAFYNVGRSVGLEASCKVVHSHSGFLTFF